MARRPRHYEVWDSTPTGADIVGHADSLLAALTLYLQTRKTAPGHTINLLVDKPTSPKRVHMIHLALWFLPTGFAATALIRYWRSIDPNPLSLPVPVIAIIAVTCVVLAGLLATVREQRRNRHRQPPQATATRDESFTGHYRELARTRAS
ncbi:MAG: hypothetical protein J2P17_24115 [Mycobacterium sp.]|nr:hypothetical protein [Mycobacterium sp.]